jgi:hypothetical protein
MKPAFKRGSNSESMDPNQNIRNNFIKIISISASHPTTLQHYNNKTQDFTTKINKEIVMEFSPHIVQ